MSELPPWTAEHARRIRKGLVDDPLLHGPGLLHALEFAKTIAADGSIKTAQQLDTARSRILEHVLNDGYDHYATAVKRVPWSWVEWIRQHPDAVIPAESPPRDDKA